MGVGEMEREREGRNGTGSETQTYSNPLLARHPQFNLSTLNKLSIKLISFAFDIAACVGGVTELLAPALAVLADPIYGFSSHSQFHFALASGYFFWALATTILFGRGLKLHVRMTEERWMATSVRR